MELCSWYQAAEFVVRRGHAVFLFLLVYTAHGRSGWNAIKEFNLVFDDFEFTGLTVAPGLVT